MSPWNGRVKPCTRSGWELPVEKLATDASKASGHKSICKACDRDKSKRYYDQNREKKLAYMNARNAALREALAAAEGGVDAAVARLRLLGLGVTPPDGATFC